MPAHISGLQVFHVSIFTLLAESAASYRHLHFSNGDYNDGDVEGGSSDGYEGELMEVVLDEQAILRGGAYDLDYDRNDSNELPQNGSMINSILSHQTLHTSLLMSD